MDVETAHVADQEPMQVDIEPVPVDTTAELLGRAKPKRPRTRSALAGPATPRGTRKTAVRKPSARRSTKSKKPGATDTPDEG
jgi:hypothetical protein